MAQKSREEGEIGSESKEKGDLPPCFPPPSNWLIVARCQQIMYQSNQSFHNPPRGGWFPRAFEFLENFCSNSTLPGPKAVQMSPPSGKLPDYCFNFSQASIMLLKLCMCKHGLLDNILTCHEILRIRDKYKSFLNTFKYV